MVCLIQAFNITGDIKKFVQISTIWFWLINWNLDKILIISGNIDSIKKADHILEMSGLETIRDCCFKAYEQMPKIISQIKNDLQVVFLLSNFVGHQLYITNIPWFDQQ